MPSPVDVSLPSLPLKPRTRFARFGSQPQNQSVPCHRFVKLVYASSIGTVVTTEYQCVTCNNHSLRTFRNKRTQEDALACFDYLINKPRDNVTRFVKKDDATGDMMMFTSEYYSGVHCDQPKK